VRGGWRSWRRSSRKHRLLLPQRRAQGLQVVAQSRLPWLHPGTGGVAACLACVPSAAVM
jgi:hypothetical protein